MTSQEYKKMRYEALINILPSEGDKINKLIDLENRIYQANTNAEYVKLSNEHYLLLNELRSIRDKTLGC
jgi:hypothetical protein